MVNLNFTVPQQIANLNAQIQFQRQRCDSSAGRAELKIAQDNLDGLEKKLIDNSNDVSLISTEINLIRSQLNDLLNKNATLYGQIVEVQGNINSLKGQLPSIQNNLNKLYVEANRGLQIIKTSN